MRAMIKARLKTQARRKNNGAEMSLGPNKYPMAIKSVLQTGDRQYKYLVFCVAQGVPLHLHSFNYTGFRKPITAVVVLACGNP